MKINYEMTLDEYTNVYKEYLNGTFIILAKVLLIIMIFFIFIDNIVSENDMIKLLIIVPIMGVIAALLIRVVLNTVFTTKFKERYYKFLKNDIGKQELIIDENLITYSNENNSYTFTRGEIHKVNQIKSSVYILVGIKNDKKKKKDILIIIPKNKLSDDEKKSILMIKNNIN